DVLDSAGIDLTEGDIAAELNIETPETQPEVTEESLDDFREFLKDLSPEDFLKSGEQQQTPPPFEDDDPDNGTEDNDDPGSSEKYFRHELNIPPWSLTRVNTQNSVEHYKFHSICETII